MSFAAMYTNGVTCRILMTGMSRLLQHWRHYKFSDTSRLFDKPQSGRIAVKVINHLGDEVMKVFRVG
jgi:hypothetical protein